MIWHRIQQQIGRDYAWTRLQSAVAIATMFQFRLLGWLFFRAGSATQIADFMTLLAADIRVTENTASWGIHVVYYCWFLWGIQGMQWRSGNLGWILERNAFVPTAFYLYGVLGIAQFFGGPAAEFLYFQF
jgi:hypothetical protein